MLDYKECPIEDFNKAMSQKDFDVQNISTAYLYILYTKFKADAYHCFQVGTSYSRDLEAKSENRVELYQLELTRRNIEIKSDISDSRIEKLWEELEDVPTDENDCLDVDWQGWNKGTHREEIWHWFDDHHSKGVGWLMNEYEPSWIRGISSVVK